MTQLYFHCANRKEVLVDRRGVVVDDLTQARDHAASVVRSLTRARSFEDWCVWVLHVSDDLGDELFVVPFAFVLGKPHRNRHARAWSSPAGSSKPASRSTTSLNDRHTLTGVILDNPKSKRKRNSLIRRARAMYDSIFPPASPVSEHNDQGLVDCAIRAANRDRNDGAFS